MRANCLICRDYLWRLDVFEVHLTYLTPLLSNWDMKVIRMDDSVSEIEEILYELSELTCCFVG